MASAPVAVFYCPKLCQVSLGKILHAVLHSVHCMDCRLLLLHGLDGECMDMESNKIGVVNCLAKAALDY